MNKKLLFVVLPLLFMFSLFTIGFPIETNAMVDDAFLGNPSVNEGGDQPTTTVDPTASNVKLWDYIKVLFALIFVLGLLLFVLRFLNKKSAVFDQASAIQNLGGVSVGQQKSVQVIKIGSQVLIVGVGDDVRILSEVKDEREIELILNSFNAQDGGQTKPYMLELLNKFNKKKTHPTGKADKDFGEVFDKTLSELKKERSDELGKWK